MVASVMFLGQAAAFTNYIADGTVSFEDKSSGSRHLSGAQAYQDSGKLAISGYEGDRTQGSMVDITARMGIPDDWEELHAARCPPVTPRSPPVNEFLRRSM
jgi:hypothetical protein